MKYKITLLRHGATQGNLEKRYVGVDDEALCPAGIVALEAARETGRYPAPPLLFCGEMRRCQETAAILYPNLGAVILPDITECNFGLFSGKNFETLQNEPLYLEWISSGCKNPFPEGESQVAFARRCDQGFWKALEVAAREQAEAFVLICHGGTIYALLDLYGYPKEDYFSRSAENGKGYCFSFDTETRQATEIRRTP